MTELMHFQPGKALYDAYQQGRGNYLAGQAFNSQGDQRQSALGQLAGLNPEKAMALKADFDEQDKADFTEFSNVILNAPEDLKPQIYAKGVQRFGHKIRALGVEPPTDYRQALPLFQQLSQAAGGKGKYTGAPIIVRGEDGKDYYARYSDNGIEQTTFRPSDSYTYDTDGAGNVWRGAKRGGDYGPAPLEGAKQPPVQPSMPQVQAGADPMAGGLDRINQGVAVLKANGVPVERINEWADAEFAKLQGSVQGGVVEQAPAQTPSQARVSVKTDTVDPLEAEKKQLEIEKLRREVSGQLPPAKQAAMTEKRRKEVNLVNANAAKVNETVRVINEILESDSLGGVTGMGAALSYVPGTRWADTAAKLETLRAKSAFGALSEMRANSPTGGALGSVTERELALLQNAETQLSTAQSPEAFREALQNYKRILLESQKRMVEGLNAFYSEQGGSVQQGGGQAPVQVRNADDYNRLPPGTQYIDPTGKQRVKK